VEREIRVDSVAQPFTILSAYERKIQVLEIHLLKLMPRSQANPTSVNCNLHHFSLKEIQLDLCLSYTWGKGANNTHSNLD
jgi:hypothetical protein